MPLVGSVGLFMLAGLCEIGGGRLIRLALREGRHWGSGVAGAVVLIFYGITPTLQPAHFGRVYAAYGGMSIVSALLWGWGFDGDRPDRYDMIGALFCFGGIMVMMDAPRT